MSNEKIMQSLNDLLFSHPEMGAFAVLDGASVNNLLPKLFALELAHVCLFRGELKPDMQEVAPYLVQLTAGSEFTEWLLREGWGKHWGIFIVAPADLLTLRQHLRKFLTVHDEKGNPMLFRYYDPRVLRTYLPTCNSEELTQIFGTVASYILEAEVSTTALSFTFAANALQTAKKSLT